MEETEVEAIEFDKDGNLLVGTFGDSDFEEQELWVAKHDVPKFFLIETDDEKPKKKKKKKKSAEKPKKKKKKKKSKLKLGEIYVVKEVIPTLEGFVLMEGTEVEAIDYNKKGDLLVGTFGDDEDIGGQEVWVPKIDIPKLLRYKDNEPKPKKRKEDKPKKKKKKAKKPKLGSIYMTKEAIPTLGKSVLMEGEEVEAIEFDKKGNLMLGLFGNSDDSQGQEVWISPEDFDKLKFVE